MEIVCNDEDGYVGKVVGEPFIANGKLYVPVIKTDCADRIQFPMFEIGEDIKLWKKQKAPVSDIL